LASGSQTTSPHVHLGSSAAGAPQGGAGAQPGPDTVLAGRWLADGEQLAEAGRFEEALALFERAFQATGSVLALNDIAVVHHRLGNLSEAAKVIAQALRLAPDDELIRDTARAVAATVVPGQQTAAVGPVTVGPVTVRPASAPPSPPGRDGGPGVPLASRGAPVRPPACGATEPTDGTTGESASPRPGSPTTQGGASAFPKAAHAPSYAAWAVPESTTIHELPLATTDAQLETMVLAMWREYVLHDEFVAAISFLEKAPYRVRHAPRVEEALALSRACVHWIGDAFAQNFHNACRDEHGEPLTDEVTNRLPGPLDLHVGQRFELISRRLRPTDAILDFGCNDGPMTNRWGLAGHVVAGIDVSLFALRVARRKAEEFATGATYFNGYFHQAPDLVDRKYDVVTCADAYEHLLDPVAELLGPARRCVHGNGRMLLVTPHGAWMRGEYKEWAHPWNKVERDGSWLTPRNRGHVLAPSVASVVADFRAAGWWVKDAYAAPQPQPDVEGQGNVFVEAFAHPPKTWPGHHYAVVDPADELGALVAALAAEGHRVQHFVAIDWREECVREGVDRVSIEKLPVRMHSGRGPDFGAEACPFRHVLHTDAGARSVDPVRGLATVTVRRVAADTALREVR
jgi:SAM-dependent methyltransferase